MKILMFNLRMILGMKILTFMFLSNFKLKSLMLKKLLKGPLIT